MSEVITTRGVNHLPYALAVASAIACHSATRGSGRGERLAQPDSDESRTHVAIARTGVLLDAHSAAPARAHKYATTSADALQDAAGFPQALAASVLIIWRSHRRARPRPSGRR